MSEPWQITLLGSLRAQRAEQVITRFKYQKVGGLLAYLAFHLRQMHAREVLVEIFWPESHPEVARNNLSTALSSLRNQFEPPGTPTGTVIRADRYSVGLNPATVTTDVAQLEAAVREAERSKSPTERRHCLERAVGLYQGHLLFGFYEAWILPEEARLAGVFFDAATSLLTDLEQQGDLSTALRYARQAVSVDPLREEMHQHLMRLLTAAGQPGAALRQYKELERLLDEEIGSEPSAPLRALARQIEKQSGLTAPFLPAPAISPIPTASPLVPPTGQPTTLTFLLTDSEGATGPWERTGDAYKAALAIHHTTLRQQFAAHGGQPIKAAGDAFVVAFSSAKTALACAVACQQALSEQAWPEETGAVKARMAVHTGDVEFVDGDYRGPALHRASRMLTAGHGGQILVSHATAELVHRDLMDEVRLVDLGVYRLRDVPTPERLHQAEYPGRAHAAFPPLAAETGYRSHLPAQATRFFGREQEIARLTEMLTPESRRDAGEKLSLVPSPRLVTLTGSGGTGKTRLALEVAEHLTEAFHGAVWFAGLADLTDPRLLADTILESLRIPRSPQREPLEPVVEFLSQQPALLVLDNFEHLVEGGAEIVQTLLKRVPTLTCLVTSRQVLGLSAEQEFLVPPLPTPHGSDTPERLSLYDSVRLFVDRAQQALPHFQVTSHNAPAVAELCDRLEGIPLAIELAAARAQVLAPGQMLAQLANRFAFLTSRKRGVEERHRTLRAAVEWSYRLLAPELQRFFARLSVFRGGWTVEAAEAVCEEPLAVDYLALLREGSLVLAEETEQAMRFRMLETLREYAQEQLTAEENILLHRQHIQFYRRFVVEGRDKEDWADSVEFEYNNLCAALDWCVTEQRDTDEGWQMAGPLPRFWMGRGRLGQGRAYLERAMIWAEAAEPSIPRAAVSNGAGILAEMLGDYAAACAHYDKCLEILRALGDVGGQAGVLSNLGLVYAFQGDVEKARALQEESLALARTLEDNGRGIAAIMLTHLGNLAISQGDYMQARAYLEEGLALEQELGVKGTGIYEALGALAFAQGNYEEVRRCWTMTLTVCQEEGNWLGMIEQVGRFSRLALAQGQPIKAARLCGTEKVLREKLGMPPPPRDYEERDRHEGAARAALGEEAFAVALKEGQAMTMEQALAYALEEDAE